MLSDYMLHSADLQPCSEGNLPWSDVQVHCHCTCGAVQAACATTDLLTCLLPIGFHVLNASPLPLAVVCCPHWVPSIIWGFYWFHATIMKGSSLRSCVTVFDIFHLWQIVTVWYFFKWKLIFSCALLVLEINEAHEECHTLFLNPFHLPTLQCWRYRPTRLRVIWQCWFYPI
jgi:hypothetical protein